MAKVRQYLKKIVKYGSEEITLFSIDGQVWSTRKEELELILERQASERANFGEQIVGGPQSKVSSLRPKTTSVQAGRMKAKPEGVKEIAKIESPPAKIEKREPQKAAKSAAKPKKAPANSKAVKAVAKPAKKAAPKKRSSTKPAAKKKGKSKKAAA